MKTKILPIVCAASATLIACSGGPAPGNTSEPGANSPVTHGGGSSPTTTAPTTSIVPATTSTSPSPSAVDVATVYKRIEPELLRCYEHGRKAASAMTDGKLTLNASVDTSGKPACVIPTEDSGLTQEVEDCMSTALAQSGERVSASSFSLPIVVRGGKVGLAEQKKTTYEIESVETHRMADAFEVVESLLPQLQSCMQGMDRGLGIRNVLVAARVGTDGRPQCALATSAQASLPTKVAECASTALRSAKFPPPKGGPGLVIIPVNLKL